eukprot:87850_1
MDTAYVNYKVVKYLTLNRLTQTRTNFVDANTYIGFNRFKSYHDFSNYLRGINDPEIQVIPRTFTRKFGVEPTWIGFYIAMPLQKESIPKEHLKAVSKQMSTDELDNTEIDTETSSKKAIDNCSLIVESNATQMSQNQYIQQLHSALQSTPKLVAPQVNTNTHSALAIQARSSPVKASAVIFNPLNVRCLPLISASSFPNTAKHSSISRNNRITGDSDRERDRSRERNRDKAKISTLKHKLKIATKDNRVLRCVLRRSIGNKTGFIRDLDDAKVAQKIAAEQVNERYDLEFNGSLSDFQPRTTFVCIANLSIELSVVLRNVDIIKHVLTESESSEIMVRLNE